MAQGIKFIVFDLGRVLVNFDHSIAARKLARFTRHSPEKIIDFFYSSSLVQSFEEGKILPEDFFQQIKLSLKFDIPFEQFASIWNEVFFLNADNKEVYGLAKSLRLKYIIALLSNINALNLEYIKKNFAVFDGFHHIFLSCQMSLIKPNPQIYLKMLEILKAHPAEVFYVDDRPELIAQANRLGIRSFVFRNAQQLKQDLLSCGVCL